MVCRPICDLQSQVELLRNSWEICARKDLSLHIGVGTRKGKALVLAALTCAAFGTAGAQDFRGNAVTEFTVWRPSTGSWYLRNQGSMISLQWGVNGDIPVPGDFDGDGRADYAFWRPSTGTWFVTLGYWWPAIAGQLSDDAYEWIEGTAGNIGDRTLAKIAANFGYQIRQGALLPTNLGNQIRSQICSH
jgi:hypothetical protein